VSNSWNASVPSNAAEVSICRRFWVVGAGDVLLAMQKVVGSNPISRFREGLYLQVFFVWAIGWTFCVRPDSIWI
jgi:hypothetical protein